VTTTTPALAIHAKQNKPEILTRITKPSEW